MNNDWKTFLETSGAHFDDGHICDFGNPRRELMVTTTGSIFSPLTHYGIIRVDGDDAQKFLQGQLTNDIEQVIDNASQLSGLCNPQGRLLALFRIFKQNDAYHLVMPSELIDDILKRLKMFVLMSKVTLEDVSSELSTIGLSGPQCEQQLSDAIGDIPNQTDAAVQLDGITVIRVIGQHPRFEFFGDQDALNKMWMKLNVHATPVGSNAWEYLDILAGMPVVYKITSGSFIPQMLNLQAVNGLSFKKGCYTGQEIIARLQYRGKLKRHMHLVTIETDTTPEPGANLYTSLETRNEAVGNIVCAQINAEGNCNALAVVINEFAQDGSTFLESVDGPVLTFLAQPYETE